MSTISTFGTFTMARLGIYTSSRAMDVVGNNIANINTEGYTRQKVDQISLYLGGADRYVSRMDARIGQGSVISGLSQFRDPYLDIRYRNEVTNQAEMSKRLDVLDQLKGVLDEVAKGGDGEGVLEADFNELISRMQALVTQGAGKDSYDTLVREAALAVTKHFNSKATQLENIYKQEKSNFENSMIPEVNEILKNIQRLTSEIRSSEIHGGDALELRDSRNLMIDKLAEFMDIDVTYDTEDLGCGLIVERLNIKTGIHNHDLVKGVYVGQLSIDTKNDDQMRIGISELKNLQDETLPGSQEVVTVDNELNGKIQAAREMLTEEGEYADANDINRDPEAATKHGIPYYRKALDTLAAKFAEVMNEINQKAGGGVLLSNGENGNATNNINAANIAISDDWANGRARLVISSDKDDSTGNDILGQFLIALQADRDFMANNGRPGADPYFTGSFQEMLTENISGTLGMDINTSEKMLDNYTTLADELYMDRDSVSGVDLNDEAMNMMQLQKSYSAACRLMTTVDEMLDKLINGTGRAGL